MSKRWSKVALFNPVTVKLDDVAEGWEWTFKPLTNRSEMAYSSKVMDGVSNAEAINWRLVYTFHSTNIPGPDENEESEVVKALLTSDMTDDEKFNAIGMLPQALVWRIYKEIGRVAPNWGVTEDPKPRTRSNE